MQTALNVRTFPAAQWWSVLAVIVCAAVTMLAFRSPVPTLSFVFGAAALFIGVRFPMGMLLLYAGSLILFQVPLAGEGEDGIAVPTATGTVFLLSTALYLVTTRSFVRLKSWVPTILLLLAVLFPFCALLNPDWVSAHPRGLLTYEILLVTTFAVAQILHDSKWAWTLGRVLIVAAVLVSMLAVYETWTGHYNPFGLFPTEPGRAYGLADPNYTAALVVTLLPFLIANFLIRRHVVFGILAALQVALACAAIAMTSSRGGVIGAMTTAVAIIAWVCPKRGTLIGGEEKRSRNAAYPRGRACVVALMLLGLSAAILLAPNILWERLATLEQWSDPTEVHGSRIPLWTIYAEEWLQSPWWGHGPGYLDTRETTPYAHNTLLQVLLEVGAFGFAGFVLLNCVGFLEALRARRRFARNGEASLSLLSGAVAASLVGFHSTAFFLNSATHKELWLLLGFASALHHMSHSKGIAS